MKQYLLLILMAVMPFAASSQIIEVYPDDIMPGMYCFSIYEPKGYNPVSSTNMPLVLFLHGRSMSIGEGGYQYGPISAIHDGIDILRGQPALIVEPSAKSGEGWSSAKLHKLYEFLVAHYAFDHTKFYVIGMSMGGWGTLNYANKYPDEVAACVGIAGGCETGSPCGLNKVPTWIIHAIDDDVTSISNSDRVVAGMKKCGPTDLLKYSRLEKGGHSLIEFFEFHNLYEWLFKHSTTNRKLNTSIDFVNKHELWTDPRRYGLGGWYADFVDIDQTKLAKIQARTPKGGNQLANNTKKAEPAPAPTKKTTPEPAKKVTPAPEPVKKTTNNNTKADNIYIVKKGDTLKSIADSHNIKLKKLRRINGFPKYYRVSAGDEIRIR